MKKLCLPLFLAILALVSCEFEPSGEFSPDIVEPGEAPPVWIDLNVEDIQGKFFLRRNKEDFLGSFEDSFYLAHVGILKLPRFIAVESFFGVFSLKIARFN